MALQEAKKGKQVPTLCGSQKKGSQHPKKYFNIVE